MSMSMSLKHLLLLNWTSNPLLQNCNEEQLNKINMTPL